MGQKGNYLGQHQQSKHGHISSLFTVRLQSYANQKNRYCTPKLSRLQSEAQKISLSKLNFYKLKKSKVNFTQHRCINTVRTIIDVLGCIDNLEIPYLLKKYCKKSTCLTFQNRESNQRRKKIKKETILRKQVDMGIYPRISF